jgi:hypothetical protein
MDILGTKYSIYKNDNSYYVLPRVQTLLYELIKIASVSILV